MHGRRHFLRQALLRGLDEIERVGRTLANRPAIVAGTGQDSVPANQATGQPRYLRPPGALEASAFVAACRRCGDCVRACPAQCIVLDPAVAQGLPHIVARDSPCVICEDLSCMKACPTEALQLVAEPGQIGMGLAVVDHDRCLRHDGPMHATADSDLARTNRACQLCVDDCPLGSSAIVIEPEGQIGIKPGCVGCGVCERVCPTEPASVMVVPIEEAS